MGAVEIRFETATDCMLCERAGDPLYQQLQDHLFGAPGRWSYVRCSRCGLVWLNPRPVPDDIGKLYARYYTHASAAPGEVFSAFVSGSDRTHRLRRWVLKHVGLIQNAIRARHLGYAELYPGWRHDMFGRLVGAFPVFRDIATMSHGGVPATSRGRLLDVGCGNGAFLTLMRDVGWEVQGVEPDPSAVAFARATHGLDVFMGVLEDARLPANSYDAVNLSHVIEHVHDPLRLLVECQRVLKPGGVLIVTTPNSASLGHRVFKAAWRGLEPPRHLHVFNSRALGESARRVGLRTERLSTSSRLIRGIWWDSRRVSRANGTGSGYNSRRDYVESYLMYIAGDIWRGLAQEGGDELIMIAKKPGSPVETP